MNFSIKDHRSFTFLEKGVLHGLSRKFWCRFGPCDLFEKREWTVPKYLWEVAWFKDGVRTGVAWEFRAGGGAVVGAVDLGRIA